MSVSGKLLVSLPNIKGGIFHKSIVYIHNFDMEGAMGFIINKIYPTQKNHQISKSLGLPHENRVFFGGPVEQQTGFVLHSNDYQGTGTANLFGNICFTPGTTILDDINRGVGPHTYMVILGHCTWAPGQLEKEIQGHAPYNGTNWALCDTNNQYFYGMHNTQQSWKIAIEQCAKERSNLLLDK